MVLFNVSIGGAAGSQTQIGSEPILLGGAPAGGYQSQLPVKKIGSDRAYPRIGLSPYL